MQDQLSKFLEFFKQHNQYDIQQGLDFEILAPGHIIYRLTIRDIHLSSPGVSHGAVIGGMMDCVLGLAALSSAVPDANLVSTIEYKTNFLSPAKLGDQLEGEGKVQFKGQSIIMVDGLIMGVTPGGPKRMVAKGMGTFNIYPMSKKRDLFNV